MFEQVFDKGDVGGHAANAELAQRSVHPRNRHFRRRGPRRDFGQQRVVEPGDDRTGIGGAAVQPDAGAGGRAIHLDAAVVGDEVVQRVFGGDPALQGVTVQGDLSLGCAACGLGQRFALGNQNLRPDDINIGDFLGDRMFDLHAGVHFDEIEFIGVHIHQELDGSGAFVVHMGADPFAQLADFKALGIA